MVRNPLGRLAHYAIELAKSSSAELIAITVLHKSLSSYGLAPAPNETEQDKEKRVLKTKEWFEKVIQEARSTPKSTLGQN